MCGEPFEKRVHNQQRCEEHVQTYAKEYRTRPEIKEQRNANWRRRYAAVGYEEHVARHYKLSADQLAEMSEKGCWVCHSTEHLCVDHDHACCAASKKTCGQCVRGILCITCNAAVGSAQNDPQLLRALANYLEFQGPRVRPSFDMYFLNIAKVVSARADCRRAQHGAVIVKSNRIAATGYNGSPSGGPSCLDGECPRGLLSADEIAHLTPDYSNCVAIHAEANAIAYASRHDTEGATIYQTGKSCDMCAKLIAAAGISRVVWPDGELVH